MEKTKYLDVRNSTENQADLYIYGDIIGNTGWKWDDSDFMPDDMKNFLDDHKGKKINLYVNSGGGSVFAGLAIYNMLKRHDGEIVAYVDGLAASIASVIIMAADKVIIPSNAFLMIHKAWTYVVGNSTDLVKQAQDLERIDEGILNTYKERLKDDIDIEEIKQMIESETWLTGDQAAKYFNIETSESLEAVACIGDSFKNYRAVPKEINLQKEPHEQKQVEETSQQEVENLLLQIELL